jgi:hypothetical protein
MTSDQFGYLGTELQLAFEGGSISTLNDLPKIKTDMDELAHIDGFIYPPRTYQVTMSVRSKKFRRVSRTTRPADLFQLPSSHTIELALYDDQQIARFQMGGFLLQSLGFLFGTKLQFQGWSVEGRIPINKRLVDFHVVPKQIQSFFERTIPTWQSMPPSAQKGMTSVLYVHNIAGALEWDWQSFLMEYMVFDGCYRVARELHKISAKSHGDQLAAFSSMFGLVPDADRFRQLVDLRNLLFHETLWDGGQIFTAQSSESFYAPIHLRKFNHRAIVALLFGPCPYSASGWTSLGTTAFQLQ